MARYALVDSTGTIQDVMLWDGVVPYTAAGGLTAVLDAGNSAQIGFNSAGGGVFSPMAAVAPAQAAAVGYNTLTFGPNLVLGSNWHQFNFFNAVPVVGQVIQNGNGLLLPGYSGDRYGASICTANQASVPNWNGTAFGGGFYIEALLSFPLPFRNASGWPAFWSEDIENMSYGFGAEGETNPTQWQGQAVGYNNWIELDFMEASFATRPGFCGTLHNWYGSLPASNASASQLFGNGGTKVPAKLTTQIPNRYGCLWVPATAGTSGYVKWFFNGVQTDQSANWNQYNASNAPPPVSGSTGFSVIDSRHMVPIIGTNTDCPMLVLGVSVWQASAAGNITQ